MKRWILGFTLIELLIVISIIGILSTVLFSSFSDSSEISRDAQRKADLLNLQNAIELYKLENGRYPEACNGPTTTHTNLVLSGHSGTYECPAGQSYIENLAPKYIGTLPVDPKLNGVNSGYVYAVNTSGTAYKVMALDTVEVEVVGTSNKFFRCDASYDFSFAFGGATTSPMDPGICVRSRNIITGNMTGGVTTFAECNTPSIYQDDFALSGGYSNDNRGNNGWPEKGFEYDTEIVRCR